MLTFLRDSRAWWDAARTARRSRPSRAGPAGLRAAIAAGRQAGCNR
jgi:hypothetical protein